MPVCYLTASPTFVDISELQNYYNNTIFLFLNRQRTAALITGTIVKSWNGPIREEKHAA